MSGLTLGGRRSSDADQWLARLPEPDPALLAAALAAAASRPIAYALGTGEAEEVALFGGLKPVIRQSHAAGSVEAAAARFSALGFSVRTVAPTETRLDLSRWLLFAGRDPDRVEAAARCEAEAAPGHERALGDLLGYPPCCVEAFLDVPQPRAPRDLARRALARAGGPGRARLNALDPAMFHYLPWAPCSLRCPASLAFADAVAASIGHRYGQAVHHGASGTLCPPGCRHARFVEAIDRALGAHRLMLTDQIQVSMTGRWDAGALRVDHAWATERDRHPGVGSDPAVREASARLAALIAGAGALALDGERLVLGERAAVPAPGAVLVPFA